MGARYPILLWVATFFSLLGAVQFGYHVGVLNTCLSFVSDDLGVKGANIEAVVVSALLVGAAVGSLLAGGLADRLGPKTASVVNTLPLFLGINICAAAEHLWPMLLGRFISGLGAGAASVYVPRYLSEIAPAEIRGALGTMNQVCINLGIVCAYAIGYPYEGGDASIDLFGRDVPWWRVMFAAALGPCLLQAVGMSLCPESPVWHSWQGRHQLAAASYLKLHGTDSPGAVGQGPAPVAVDAEEPLLAGSVEGTEAGAAAGSQLGWGALLAPKYRRVMILAAGLPLFQQLSGINTVIFYSSEVFKQAGLSSPILGSILMGLVNLGMTLVTALLMDRAGRKPLLTSSHAGMAACLGIMAAFMWLPTPHSLEGTVTLASILAYVLFFALGSGPIPWVYLPEILPLEIKGNAQALCTCLNWVSNLVVGLSFPAMLHALNIAGSYAVYAVFNIAAAVFMARWMVETKRQSLFEIRAMLVVPDTGS